MNILAFTNGTASHRWRLSPIAKRFNEEADHEMFVTPWNTWNNKTMGAQLVIMEMLSSPEMVEMCHALGAKVIYEADDAVIDSYGMERKNLQRMGAEWRKAAIETIRSCDAVTVTNKVLAENYARFTDKPIFVLPNYMDPEWYDVHETLPPRATDEIRIGWFGSRGHFEDLKMVAPALKKVLAKYPNAKLVYCGYGGMSSEKVVTEIGWGEDVFADIPRTQREFILSVPEDLWPIKHKSLDLDIGLCPLIDDEFNHCKSPIKWMEYAMLGTPSVVSPTVYTEHPLGTGSVVKHMETALVASTEEEWVKNISLLIENTKLRKKIGKAAKREVLDKWNLNDHYLEYARAYETVVSNP